MPVAIFALVAGGVIALSALKGISIADALKGALGGKLNPAGSKSPVTSSATGVGAGDVSADDNIITGAITGGALGALGGTGQFKGPNAAKLEALRKVLENRFHLKIIQICRPQNATYGAADSLHKSCRAMDASGKVADMIAAARYCKTLPWVSEVFCDQAGMPAANFPGGHTDHMHVGA